MSLRGAPLRACATGAQAGRVVCITIRRLGFTGLVLANGSTTVVTLNRSLEFIPNVDPAARAACG